jgi:hypothetical protein
LQIQAFARDTVGNCGASVTNTLTALPCDSILPPVSPSKFFVAKNTPGLSLLATVVPGFARPLPTAGSQIADVFVDMDPVKPRMYLSNFNFNRLEVLNLQDSTFAPAVSVGSEPWGMATDNTGTRLMVANSGGTNISFVDITQPVNSIQEVPAERILTPNSVLFDVSIGTSNGLTRYIVTAHDFSDRPQFIGEDANGVIVYSTKPTGAAPDGTVRYLTNSFPRRESKILYNRNAIIATTDGLAIAHIDSALVIRHTTTSDEIQLWDHDSGNPASWKMCQAFDVLAAVNCLKTSGAGTGPGAASVSDVDANPGAWDLGKVGLSDTTYVAMSGDRQYLALGEGGVGENARIWIWSSSIAGISDDISVQDLVGNAAERVLGVSLNRNGLIGAARGGSSAYFFSNDASFEGQLRLQGIFTNGVAGGSGGVALHPSHVDATLSNSTTLAFIATVNRSIKIVDTFNFRERGEILIRDNIVGPLRAALPLATENFGLAECDQIWVKLYGVTGAGKAVIINVRKKDVINPTITAAVCPS